MNLIAVNDKKYCESICSTHDKVLITFRDLAKTLYPIQEVITHTVPFSYVRFRISNSTIINYHCKNVYFRGLLLC